MKVKKKTLFALVAIVVIAFAGIKITGFATSGPGPYDDLAKHITESGAKMYGAYWCSACESQKESFGSSWQYIDYVECSENGGGQTQECISAGITSYPTWEFADGSRQSGAIPLQTLALKTGFTA